MTGQKRIRILQIVSVMDRGGIETWLMHVLRNIDRTVFSVDFLTQTTQKGEFDEEIRDLGSKLLPCLHPSHPWKYAASMRNTLKTAGPYQVVHSHVHHYNGFTLRMACAAGVPVRIAHSHKDSSVIDATATLARKGYLHLSKKWISRFASCKLAASRKAALSLFGPARERNNWKVLPCGLELQPFGATVNRNTIRAELSIPDGAFVIGHVGRFCKEKNHLFLVDIAASMIALNPRAHFLLVGDGPLRSAIEQQVATLNLTKHFSFLGVRPDIPRLMLGAMDVFLFPSLNEGLGLALVEAQAAGVPCFCSNIIPEEADIVNPLVHRISLQQPASGWAEALLNQIPSQRGIPEQKAAFEQVQRSPFNIDTTLPRLEEIYREA